MRLMPESLMIWANIDRILAFDLGRGEDLWVVGQEFLMLDPILTMVTLIFLFCFHSLKKCVEINLEFDVNKSGGMVNKDSASSNILLSNLVLPAEIRSLPHVPLQKSDGPKCDV